MPGSLFEIKLHTVIRIFGAVARTTLEEIIIGLDIRGQINCLAGRQLPGSIEHDIAAMMIGAFKVTGKPNITDIFTTFCRIS